MRLAKLVWLCAKSIPRGRTVVVESGTPVSCSGCAAAAYGMQRTKLGPNGVWRGATQAPDGWGIRYVRQSDAEPTPTYYCGPCSKLVSAGKLKV